MHYDEQQKNHDETTKYSKWEEGMYILLDDLSDHEMAIIENWMRGAKGEFSEFEGEEECLKRGVCGGELGYGWHYRYDKPKLTPAQALYIATGRTCF